MRPGREIDVAIAKNVFGHDVKSTKKGLIEKATTGDRPLKNYSKEMTAAWAVVEKMNITLLPVANDEWFAMVAAKRWSGPAEFITYLAEGNFVNAGAAVGPNPALTVCLAALKALEHRDQKSFIPTNAVIAN